MKKDENEQKEAGIGPFKKRFISNSAKQERSHQSRVFIDAVRKILIGALGRKVGMWYQEKKWSYIEIDIDVKWRALKNDFKSRLGKVINTIKGLIYRYKTAVK